MKNYKVTMFPGICIIYPSEQISLWQWLFQESENRDLVDLARSARDETDSFNIYEGLLPCITPSCITTEDGWRHKLTSPTGLICIYINGCDNPDIPDLEELKQKLSVKTYIMCCGLLFDGKGLYCLIPIAHPIMHKEHFYALQKDFKDEGIVIDPTCNQELRLLYSYDNKYYYNQDAVAYRKLAGDIKMVRSESNTQDAV